MFHEVSERLVAWAAAVAGEPIAGLDAPSAGTSVRRISLSLIDVIPLFVPSAEATAFEVSLRYLVTASAETPVESHRLLGQLTFAAMAERDITVDPERPQMQFWLAQGVAPQPCVVLRVTAHRAIPARAPAPRIDRRQAFPRPLVGNGRTYLRRAGDSPAATVPNDPDSRTRTSTWRERC